MVRAIAGEGLPSVRLLVKYRPHSAVVRLTYKVSRIVFENPDEYGLNLRQSGPASRYQPDEESKTGSGDGAGQRS
jgi:hypothetical protein